MPDSLKLDAYEDRASSKLGVADYLRKHAFSVMLPFMGMGVGFGLRKVVKHPFLEQAYVFPFFTPKAVRTAVEANAAATGTNVWRNSEVWGGKIAGVWGLYSLWRDRSQAQHGIDDVQKHVLTLKEHESADSYLARENAQLRYQLGIAPDAKVEQVSYVGRTDMREVAAERS